MATVDAAADGSQDVRLGGSPSRAGTTLESGMARRTARVGGIGLAVAGVVWGRREWAGAQDAPPPPPPPPHRTSADIGAAAPTTRPLPPLAAGERRAAVRFDGGHDTDGGDRGRPVVLVAAALDVPADAFRRTFSHVHPAGPGSGGPTDAEARQNKADLLAGLSPYGVTDERLNAVSDYYRYRRGRDQLWRHRAAVAYAVVRADGTVARFDVADAGAGYTTPPVATIDGLPDATVAVTLAFGTTLPANGSIRSLAVTPVDAPAR